MAQKQAPMPVLIVLAIIIIGLLIYAFLTYGGQKSDLNLPIDQAQITNFEQCAAAGNPVMESYPRQCTANGQTFTENIGNELAKTDLIQIDNPRPNQTISSPLEIAGQARGYWFFEASFPIKLLDGNGQQIAQGIAQAQSEWMTENFVPFTSQLEFTKPATDKGTLILEKDNPSDLPEFDDSLIVPVKF